MQKRMLTGRAVVGMVPLLGALVLGGCPAGSAPKIPASQPAFSTLGVPSVSSDATLQLAARRYLTGCVPAAFAVNTGDQGQRFFARVAIAAKYGECFVSRPRMDWERFGPNGDGQLSDDLVNAAQIARNNGMPFVVVEIDPVADRRHVGVLPPELAGKTFADAEVRDPIKRMAVQTALQLHPKYLSIGVEMNGYYEANPDDFANYVQLHKETYDLVKTAAPDVEFIAAFNLEALQGFYGNLDAYSNHPPQWFLFDMFEPKLDAVAFATLPFGFYLSPLLMPDDYLSRIEQHTARDILFTEIGWPGDAQASVYTLPTQVDYLAQTARLLDRMSQVRLVVWTTLFDADPDASGLVTPAFQTLGLFDHLDTPKPALDVWRQIVALPYQP